MNIGDKLKFDYTGDVQEVTLEKGTYQFECWGAQGGNSAISDHVNAQLGVGGKGGYSRGEILVQSPQTFYIYVGGVGLPSDTGIAEGGWNGGGCSWASNASDPAGGGGGATDIRLVGGEWDNEEGLYSRIIVAGGGGGGGEDGEVGGYGGGEISGGTYSSSQSTSRGGAVFGKGAHTNYDGGGGGGGWFGGGTLGGSQNRPTANSTSDTNGASGGSGYVLTSNSYKPGGYTPSLDYYFISSEKMAGNETTPTKDGTSTQVGHEGNGYCVITQLSDKNTHVLNQLGSTELFIPNKIRQNDLLMFNATNIDTTTKYNGTMLTYTFPFDCKAKLNAYGARGGKGAMGIDSIVGRGARASGVFEFKKDDTLLICIGQAGTDSFNTTLTGSNGAGGGGTFVVLKTDDQSDDTYTGTGVGNVWKIKPLIVGAGGNGARTSSTIFNGLYSSSITTNMITAYAGGGYSQSHTTTNAGKNFLIGAQGATYNHNTVYHSYAGFGGGGAGNSALYNGGGGGGYYNGTVTRSASSYVNPIALEQDGEDGVNLGEGRLIIEFLEVPVIDGNCKINNEYREIETMSVKIDNEWREAVATYVKINNEWKESTK